VTFSEYGKHHYNCKLPRLLKNAASFLNVCDADRRNFAANEATDCGQIDTTTVFMSVMFPA